MDRVFLASYNDIDQWGRRSDSVLNTIEEDDVIFLIRNDKELNVPKTNLIEKMKTKCQLKLSDDTNKNPGSTGKELLKKYLEKCKEKPIVYIIGPTMQCIYHDCKDLKVLATDIIYHHNFQVKKIKIEAPSEESQLLMNLTQATVESSKPKNRQERPLQSSGQKLYFNDTNTDNLEKKILDNKIVSTEYKEPHSDLQDAKALLSFFLLERIREHIKKLLFNQSDTTLLTETQLLRFILLCNTAKDSEDFNTSWNAVENDPTMKLKEPVYKQIKAEIMYYSKMVTFMYEEDQWEV